MTEKKSGIFLPISSLPGSFASGDFGPDCYEFIEFLNKSHQSYWQVLPLNPLGKGCSPYSSPSAFALDPIYIDQMTLESIGLKLNYFTILDNSAELNKNSCNFEIARQQKMKLLAKAFQVYAADPPSYSALADNIQEFSAKQSYWLEDYALFTLLSQEYMTLDWRNWPITMQSLGEVEKANLKRDFGSSYDFVVFCQYLAQIAWQNVKKTANSKGIKIIGDIPIYVDLKSSDTWSHPELFQFKPGFKLELVSGVPPDKLSSDGQKWDHPLYKWDAHKNDNFTYWKRKLSRLLELYDDIRLDHFIGFKRYFAVPAEDKNARNGRWNKGPGSEFFKAIKAEIPSLPFIAEDLGTVGDDVYELRDEFNLPGMGVYVFGFCEKDSQKVHNPKNIKSNMVYYSSTHDTETLWGWYKRISSESKLNELTKAELSCLDSLFANTAPDSHWQLIESIMKTDAYLVILPFQDILGLDNSSRFNFPGTVDGNWKYRFAKSSFSEAVSSELAKNSDISGRG